MAVILWEGASLLEPSTQIRVYGTGHDKPSTNTKTGELLQTYILHATVDPVEAVRSGQDSAICGNCVHRQAPRSCYVNIGQAPLSIFRGMRHTRDANNVGRVTFGMGYAVRLGSYGDPAAVPYEIWAEIVSWSLGWLGYTHQWRTCDQRLKRLCMASVDSAAERDEAHDLGWRTFYVGRSLDDLPADERITLCPASAEAGKRMTCEECMSCSGLGLDNRVGDVFIPAHGATWQKVNFKRKAA